MDKEELEGEQEDVGEGFMAKNAPQLAGLAIGPAMGVGLEGAIVGLVRHGQGRSGPRRGKEENKGTDGVGNTEENRFQVSESRQGGQAGPRSGSKAGLCGDRGRGLGRDNGLFNPDHLGGLGEKGNEERL